MATHNSHSWLRTIATFLSLGIVSLLLFFILPQPADAGSIYLSPGARTVSRGATFSVSVRTNTGGDSVNAVQANLSYPADKLDFVGISGGGSAFTIDAPSSGGGGGVSISRGVIGGVTGDKLIATVTFRAKAGVTGVATVGVAGGSALVRASDQANVYSGGAGGTYTISASVIQSTPKPGTSSNTGSSNSPTATPLPLKISEVKVTNVSFKTAMITWKTDRKASSIVQYGLNDKYGLVTEKAGATTEHTVLLSSELLVPGAVYHFRVKSIDENDVEGVSQDGTFTTTGIKVTLLIRDESGNVVPHAKVTLVTPQSSLVKNADANGLVIFENVPTTNHTVITDVKGVQHAMPISVKEPTDDELKSGTAKPQSFTVKVAGASMQKSDMQTFITIGVVVILLILILFIIRRKRRPPQNGQTVVQQPTPIQPAQQPIQQPIPPLNG